MCGIGGFTSRPLAGGRAVGTMLSVFLRFAMQLRQNSFLTLSRCRIEALPCSLAKITVDSTMRWRPGQHVFVRFPGLAPLTAHPFTIVSMPAPDEQQLLEAAAVAGAEFSSATLVAALDGTQDAIEFLLDKLKGTKNNDDFFQSMNQ